jgi:hypothetical protein
MEVLLIIAAVAASNIVCFTVGAKVGQTVSKGEPVKMPSVNPLEAYRAHEEKKEAQRQQEEIETILYNVNNYNGTAAGQKDLPGR